MGTKNQIMKANILKLIKENSLIIIGSIIAAAGINIFLVPNKIVPGGATGIATVIHYISKGKIPIGVLMILLNIPLLIMGKKYIGKKFFLKTLFATTLLSVIIDILEPFTNYFVQSFLVGTQSPVYSSDIALYSVFGGFFMGAGLGLVFKSGATTGGSDLAAKIINHFVPNFTVGQILLFIDTFIILFATIAFKSIVIGLYAIVTLFVTSKVIDAILEGVNFAKAVYIISEKTNEISQSIMFDLDRGVTALKATGMYTGKEKEVLLCVVYRNQIFQLKNIVKSIDPNAFIILADVREVLGEGFKTHE